MATTVIKKNRLTTRFQIAYRPRANGTLAPIIAFGDDISGAIGLTHMPDNSQAYADIGNAVYVPFSEAAFGSSLVPFMTKVTQRLREAYKPLDNGVLAPIIIFGSDASNPTAIPGLQIAKQIVQPYVTVATGIVAPYMIAIMNEGATVVERDLDETKRMNLAYKAMAGGVLAPIVVFGTNTSSPVTRGNKVEDQRQAYVELSPGLFAPFYALFQDNPAVINTPVNLTLPSLTGSDAREGVVLNLDNGTWTNSPTGYTRTLRRENTVLNANYVAGTYTPVTADVGSRLFIDVVAANANGSSPVATSLPTAVIQAAVVTPADSRPRFFNAPATGYNVETALGGAAVIAGSANGDAAGTANVQTTANNYGWLAIKASSVPNGINISNVTDGAGGWSGAGLPGNNAGASPSPAIVFVAFTDAAGTAWKLFRMDYLNSAPSAKPFVFSAA